MTGCPLCGAETSSFHEDDRREYRRCDRCSLISVPPRFHLSSPEARREYELHENHPSDAGYRRFLGRAADAVRARVHPPASGLDFGCGPSPTLSHMLEEDGYTVAAYDPLFAPNRGLLDAGYDFITATEVFEHLQDPRATLEQLLDCLEPRGWLVVMTKRARDHAAFARWHYIRDPTHIVFFSDDTFRWLAVEHDLALEIAGPDVVALRRR